MLAREVYGEKFNKVAEFNFEENVDGTDHDKYLWMNAAWAYATRVTDAYDKFGWMARTPRRRRAAARSRVCRFTPSQPTMGTSP